MYAKARLICSFYSSVKLEFWTTFAWKFFSWIILLLRAKKIAYLHAAPELLNTKENKLNYKLDCLEARDVLG